MNPSTSAPQATGIMDATSRSMTNISCPKGLCDGSGVLTVDGEDVTCNCPAGLELEADVIAHPLSPFTLSIDEDEPDESPAAKRARLKELGAPAHLYLDLSDAACCADGLCKECESVI